MDNSSYDGFPQTVLPLFLFINTTLIFVVRHIYTNQANQIKLLNTQLQDESNKRAAERNGRINIQKTTRKQIISAIEINGYNYYPIAKIESPFPDRRGTPRQPILVPAAHGIIRFNKQIIQLEHYAELKDFSHIWVIFVFHDNTNVDKAMNNNGNSNSDISNSGNNFSVISSTSSSPFMSGIPSKVKPPRLNKRVGCLSTRSPHRPNNIGLSVCQVLEVGSDYILIGGVDMVHGTPVLDIKPYIPYDSIPLLSSANNNINTPTMESSALASLSSPSSSTILTPLTVPEWIYESAIETLPVHFSDIALQELTRMDVDHEYGVCVKNAIHAQELIAQVLKQDIRGVHQGRGQSSSSNNKNNANNNNNNKDENLNSSNFVSIDSKENTKIDNDSKCKTSDKYTCRLDNMLIEFYTKESCIQVTTISSSSSLS